MAARGCGKKDWGEARPSPYGVESCPEGPFVDLALYVWLVERRV